MADDQASRSAQEQATDHAVFISYSAKDRRTGDAICKALEAQEIRCWIAPRDIPHGDNYADSIIEAISAARVFVIVFSSNSNSSNDVKSEVESAFQKEIPIIPFRVENVQPSGGMQYFLSNRQFLEAFAPPLTFHLENLVDTVLALLKAPRKTQRKRTVSPIQLKVTVGVVLALVIGGLLLFNPFKPIDPNVTTDYEKQFGDAVELLSSPDLPKRLEGIGLLDKISESDREDLYWRAMTQLTAYVQKNARWTGSANQPPNISPDIEAILRVIAARPPRYPANFTEQDKFKKRRELKRTDLRGLRLVNKAHLEYVDLQGANLEGAVLTGANLQGAMLKDAILRDADLGGTCIEGVDLAGADVFGAILRTTNETCAGTDTANTEARIGRIVNAIMVAPNWECAGLPDEVLKQIQVDYGEIPKCE